MFNSRYKSRFLGILFLCSITFCLWLSHLPLLIWQEKGEVAYAQISDASKLMQQGVESYQIGKLQDAIKYWQEALKIYQNNDRASEAVVLENLARVYQQTGQLDKSITHWDHVITYYRQVGDVRQVGRMLTEQAQVYNSLGQPRKVIAVLCGVLQEDKEELPQKKCLQESALEIALAQKDRIGEAAALGSLGEAYRLVGYYNRAIKYLNDAEKIAPKGYDFLVLNSLGNVYVSRAQLWELRAESAKQIGVPKGKQFEQQSKSDYDAAFNKFQASFEKADQQGNQYAQVQVLVNLIKFYYRTKADQTKISAALEKALALREKLSDSTSKVYITVDLANLPVVTEAVTSPITQCLKRQLPDAQALALLEDAVQIADKIQDSRSESFANGALGHFYECRHSYEQALQLTQDALLQADQKLLAKDSVYLWQWQTGRIFRAQEKKLEAVTAYQEAYSTLEEIRSDILEADKDLQFDFRDVVEPLYRELAQLKLELASLTSSAEPKKRQLTNSALETIDSLKLAELQNYFGNDCVITAINQSKNVDELLKSDTAVFSSIIFNNRTAILLSLPNGNKQLEWIDEKRDVLEAEIKKFYELLIDGAKAIVDDEIKEKGQYLYNKIFSKFENANLNPDKIKNIVFIQDSFLRSIPMAALYDGKQYLIEKYAVATTPSLRLTAPKNLNRQSAKALILGVTTEAKVDEKKYQALQNVDSEINKVKVLFPGSKLLVDNYFNFNNLEKELDKTVYPIIHISTHAQFGTIAEDTFLVAGNNEKLTIKQLETALRQVNGGSNSVELLTLTACQTAVGDDRATLGLAGVALQVGVKSALASLWAVDDKSTFNLITEFYTNYRKLGVSKAEALRQAQIKMIKDNNEYSNPYYWAPFIISGNWL
ncbi:TPR repeat protein [Calothrix sp. NIES-4071]|nr:TPR repeat protein [Calothrix sp. NIES-4071]BAZ54526.1 TPR repeat protein [Calothrix sp. NIES-4105]